MKTLFDYGLPAKMFEKRMTREQWDKYYKERRNMALSAAERQLRHRQSTKKTLTTILNKLNKIERMLKKQELK